MTKIYELPLTREYVRNWTAVEAIRELLQNALDYGHGALNCTIGEGTMQINSDDAYLDPKTLLLGCTSKADNAEAIGSFGEGYKIALLVLAREGIDVTVYNRGVAWKPVFNLSPSFGAEVLMIEEKPYIPAISGVAFCLSGLPEEVINKVKDNTLQLQASHGPCHNVEKGEILIDHPGKLYVNGLFVADTGLEVGYNVKPQYLKLERDRQTVSSFDLKFLTKEMWFSTGRTDDIVSMMEKGAEDLEYAKYGAPELVKEACYRAFIKKHPGAIVAESQQQVDAMVKDGMTNTIVIYPSSYSSLVSNHAEYADLVTKTVKVTPQMEMKTWLATNGKDMNRKTKASFRELIEKSAAWK